VSKYKLPAQEVQSSGPASQVKQESQGFLKRNKKKNL
jgi:hypothetical protein